MFVSLKPSLCILKKFKFENNGTNEMYLIEQNGREKLSI